MQRSHGQWKRTRPRRLSAVLYAVALLTITQVHAQAPGFPAETLDPESRAAQLLEAGGGGADVAEAIRLLETAAEAGGSSAALMLADVLSKGRYVEPDLEAAIPWYRRAAEAGSAEGMFAMGFMNLNANDGSERNPAVAAMWFRSAAHQQHPAALFYLSQMHFRGDGVEYDIDLGYELLRRSAELGNALAAVELGRAQLQPDNDWFDPAAGEFWLNYWAQNNYAPAQRILGMYLLVGTHLTRNTERAADLLSTAAGQGDSYSGLWAAEIFERGIGMPANSLTAALLRRNAMETADASIINAVAWDLSVLPDALLRNGAGAVALMEPLMNDAENRRPALLDTLAAAYAEAGDFDAAVETQAAAIELIPADEQYDAMRGAFEERRSLFASGQPFRESTQ